MRKQRGFEVANGFYGKVTELPVRGTSGSAGYDFCVLNNAVIPPGESRKFDTGVKAYMLPDEVLKLYPRSSLGIKKNTVLANTIPVIDHDYYGNPTNDGHIIIALRNEGEESVEILAGERVAQGIFEKYLLADDDEPLSYTRISGIGSTGK